MGAEKSNEDNYAKAVERADTAVDSVFSKSLGLKEAKAKDAAERKLFKSMLSKDAELKLTGDPNKDKREIFEYEAFEKAVADVAKEYGYDLKSLKEYILGKDHPALQEGYFEKASVPTQQAKPAKKVETKKEEPEPTVERTPSFLERAKAAWENKFGKNEVEEVAKKADPDKFDIYHPIDSAKKALKKIDLLKVLTKRIGEKS